MKGSSKYDDHLTRVRIETEAAAVVLIVVDGNRGHGFGVQCEGIFAWNRLPGLLRLMATELEANPPLD